MGGKAQVVVQTGGWERRGACLEREEDGGAEEERRLADGLGGVRLRRALAGRVGQQRHAKVQRDVVGGRDLVRPCIAPPLIGGGDPRTGQLGGLP